MGCGTSAWVWHKQGVQAGLLSDHLRAANRGKESQQTQQPSQAPAYMVEKGFSILDRRLCFLISLASPGHSNGRLTAATPPPPIRQCPQTC